MQDQFNSETPRTTGLSSEALQHLKVLNPHTVLVGMASHVQELVLKLFPQAITIASADNFNYDPSHESFKTVSKIHAVARHILCPSQNTVDTLVKECNDPSSLSKKHTYHIVGKPTLESWEAEINEINKNEAIEEAGLEPTGGPIITFVGGYGPGYEIINPLFSECSQRLREEGYRVLIQPHPRMAPQKIKTTAALAISDVVVGYNSSVILDAAIIGKNALYLVPEEVPFDHFAIRENLLAKVTTCENLLDYIHSGKKPVDVRKTLNMPQNSITTICELIDRLERCKN